MKQVLSGELNCKTLIVEIDKYNQVELNLEQFKKEYEPYRHMTGWDIIINPVIKNDRIESGVEQNIGFILKTHVGSSYLLTAIWNTGTGISNRIKNTKDKAVAETPPYFLKHYPETTSVELCGRGGHSCQIYCRTLSRPATNFACISYGFYNLNLCFIQGFFVSQNFTFCLILLHSVKIWYIMFHFFTFCRNILHLAAF